MENKTALQELIQKLESFKTELKEKYDGDPLVTRGISIAIKEANKLLEKEKEQIKKSYLEGDGNGCGCYDFLTNEDAEQYYNETYKQ